MNERKAVGRLVPDAQSMRFEEKSCWSEVKENKETLSTSSAHRKGNEITGTKTPSQRGVKKNGWLEIDCEKAEEIGRVVEEVAVAR